jgi:hypothetical protein
VADNPIRCAFTEWTAGSFLSVTARLAFSIISGGASLPVQLVGSSRIAIDVGAGFQQASRTGSGIAAGLTSVAGTYHTASTTAAHAHLLGPFDVAPVVALASNWSLASSAHLSTGVNAQNAVLAEGAIPLGVGLVCAEVSAECIVAAQPPELVTVPLVDPRFAA